MQLSRVQKVVFIPIQPLDFEDDALIRRFQGVLANAAPTWDMRETFSNLEVTELAPHAATPFSTIRGTLGSVISSRGSLLDPPFWENILRNPLRRALVLTVRLF